MSRLLTWYRAVHDSRSKEFIPGFVKKDLFWWSKFLPDYNGVSMMAVERWSVVGAVIATDACLEGCGGVGLGEYFHSPFPKWIQRKAFHINALELLTIVVALRIWGHKLTGKRILIHCDNLSSVQVLNSGSTRDSYMQACLREICFHAACWEFEIRGHFIPGVENRLPDLLSRWDLSSGHRSEFIQRTEGSFMSEVKVMDADFAFTHRW